MSRTLVAYFSATGRSKGAAVQLAKAAGARLYEIVPETPYEKADLNWMDKHSRSTLEMNDKSSRPAIAGELPDAAEFDTLFVGFPIWWYTCPAIIRTFLEGMDLSGKTVVPFATSGSSGIDKAAAEMARYATGAKIAAGRMLNGSHSDSELAAWVAEIG